MEPNVVAELGRMLLREAMILSAPLLICGCLISIGLGLLQTLTSVQEQTLTVVPRLFVVFGAAMLTLPWFLHRIMTYTITLWRDFHRFLG